MPTYEYHCDACEHEFEELQGFNDPVLTKCPECGKKKLRRLFGTGSAILFKGSGFYQTDYRSEAYKAAAKADQEKQSGAGGSGKNGASETNGTGGTEKAEAKAKPKKDREKRSKS
jgi:putative FmdB family regulatory protein